MSLFKEAMSDIGVSVEEFQAIPVDGHVEDPILPNVTQEPSSSIPVSQAVAEAVPAPVEAPVAEPVPMTVAEVEQVVETVEPVVECAVQEHEMLRERAEQLVAIQTAMEQYHDIIRKRGFNGITPESAQILQVHMRIAARQLGTNSKVASMEAFKAKDAREQHDLAEISMEDLRTTAKVAGNVIHQLIGKMISAVKQFAMRIVDGIPLIEKALASMDKELGQIKSAGGDGEVKINTTMLNVNGVPDLTVGKEVMSLAMFAAKTYPDAVVTFLKGATKAVFKYDPEEDNSDEMKAYFQEAARPLQSAIKAGANDEPLPGGYKMHISESGMSVGITGEDMVGQTHREVQCSTTKELRDACRKLQEMVKIIREIRPSAERIETEGHKLLKAVERIRDRAGDDKRWAHEVMDDESRKLVMEATPRSGELIGYLLKYIKSQMVAIKTQAEHISRTSN